VSRENVGGRACAQLIISLTLNLLCWDQVIPIRSQSSSAKSILLTSVVRSFAQFHWLEIKLLGKNSLSPRWSAGSPISSICAGIALHTHCRLLCPVRGQTRHPALCVCAPGQSKRHTHRSADCSISPGESPAPPTSHVITAFVRRSLAPTVSARQSRTAIAGLPSPLHQHGEHLAARHPIACTLSRHVSAQNGRSCQSSLLLSLHHT